MQFQVNRLDLLAAVRNAEKVAQHQSKLEIMNGILLEADTTAGEVALTATNFEASIWCRIPAEVSAGGMTVVNAKLLYGMATLMKGENLTINHASKNSAQVTFTDEKSTFVINCLPGGDYPRPTESSMAPDARIPLSNICSLAKKTAFAVATTDDKPVLQCISVQLGQGIAAATDGTKMMMVRMEKKEKENASTATAELLLPATNLQLLASMSTDDDIYSVSVTDRHIIFAKEQMAFSMRRIEGTFIQPAQIIKAVSAQFTAIADAGLMYEAIDLVQTGMDNMPIGIALGQNTIRFVSETATNRAYHEIEAAVTAPTPEDGFYYNAAGLLKLFSTLTGNVKIEMDAKGMLLVKTQKEVYFQLPQRKPVIDRTAKAKKTASAEKAEKNIKTVKNAPKANRDKAAKTKEAA